MLSLSNLGHSLAVVHVMTIALLLGHNHYTFSFSDSYFMHNSVKFVMYFAVYG